MEHTNTKGVLLTMTMDEFIDRFNKLYREVSGEPTVKRVTSLRSISHVPKDCASLPIVGITEPIHAFVVLSGARVVSKVTHNGDIVGELKFSGLCHPTAMMSTCEGSCAFIERGKVEVCIDGVHGTINTPKGVRDVAMLRDTALVAETSDGRAYHVGLRTIHGNVSIVCMADTTYKRGPHADCISYEHYLAVHASDGKIRFGTARMVWGADALERTVDYEYDVDCEGEWIKFHIASSNVVLGLFKDGLRIFVLGDAEGKVEVHFVSLGTAVDWRHVTSSGRYILLSGVIGFSSDYIGVVETDLL
jgi:hypothetical protein